MSTKFELLDVSAGGKFVNTLFGESLKDKPKKVDVNTGGSLDSELFDSSVGLPPENTNTFTNVRAEGIRRIEEDEKVAEYAASKGTTPRGLVADSLEQAPLNVDSYGTLFDDGEIGLLEVTDYTARMRDTMPRDLFDNMDSGTYNKALLLTKKLDDDMSEDGCDYGKKLATEKKVSRANGTGVENADKSTSGAFLLATVLSTVTDDLCADALGAIDSIGERLGVKDSDMEKVKKRATEELSKLGAKSQTMDVLEDVGMDKFSPQERKAINNNLRENYKTRPSVRDGDLSNESKDLIKIADKLDSGWDKVSGSDDTEDLSVYQKASPDWLNAMLRNPETASKAALASTDVAKVIKV